MATPSYYAYPGKRVPAEKPSFTVATLRAAIPKHCWERSALRSFAYLAVDLVLIAALYYASTFIDSAPVPTWVKWGVLWPAYWFWQGAVATGVWVIAHECGHQAFSESQAINDAVGLVLHSCLLVPYYSWKHSHRRHHSNTGNLAKDEVFVPPAREEVADPEAFDVNQLAIVRLAKIVTSLTIGWPLYLLFNVSGRPYERFANHFDPWSPIFNKSERVEIVISDIALAAVVYGLAQLGNAYGWGWLFCIYGVPQMIANGWLVLITLLQHTHPALPHYDDKEWDWLRGALATVDRNYGILTHFHHRIADTHVCHHLFSTIPHYNAVEATEAIKPVLGEYYLYDDRFLPKALWQDWRSSLYVAPDKGANPGVKWYHPTEADLQTKKAKKAA
ncbi:hypothetical protein N2152v2_010479 [Parachlorella kessleri]